MEGDSHGCCEIGQPASVEGTSEFSPVQAAAREAAAEKCALRREAASLREGHALADFKAKALQVRAKPVAADACTEDLLVCPNMVCQRLCKQPTSVQLPARQQTMSAAAGYIWAILMTHGYFLLDKQF